ncbi:putative HMP/thiamine permease protein YkoE [subsurface metagenome]
MEKERKKYYFSTFDLILMAIIAVIGGRINGVYMFSFIQIFKPLFALLGPISWVPLSGLYVIWLIIVKLLIRKKGSATLCGLIQGIIESLSGNPFGLWAILFAIVEGFLIDVVFAIIAEKATLLSSLLGASLATLFAVYIFFFINKMTSPFELYIGGIVAILSGIIFAGLLGWLIAKAIYNTGIIKRGNL